jgi:hypothetical protein
MNLRKEIKRILSEASGEEPSLSYQGVWDYDDTSGGATKGMGYVYTGWSDGRVSKAKVIELGTIYGRKIDHDNDSKTPEVEAPVKIAPDSVVVLDGYPDSLKSKITDVSKNGFKRLAANSVLDGQGGIKTMRPDLYGNPPAAVQPASGGASAAPAATSGASSPAQAPSSASPSGKTPVINLENKGGSPIAAYVFLMTQAQVDKLKISDEIDGGFKPSDSPKYEVAVLTFAGGISAVPEKKESKRIDQLQNATKMTGEHVAYIVNVTSGEIKSDGSFEPKAFLGYAAGSLRASK